MSAVVPSAARARIVRPPVGLLLSTGAPKPERGPGRPIDYIRPKEGTLAQYATEAAKYAEVYGDAPKSLSDVYFLVDDPTTVLQIRLTAFSQTGIRAIGQTNYAGLPADEFLARAWSYEDDILFFPKDQSEVRPELRENWEGAPIPGRLEGYDDPRRETVGFKLTASLEFCLPRVMGVGKVARISTSSRNSIRNLYAALWDSYYFFGQRLIGVPFRLAIRPKPTQRFDREAKKFTSTTVYELVLDTPLTIDEIYAEITRHRSELGYVDDQARGLESRMLTQALALNAPSEDAQTRDEPEPNAPSDALLNRVARLEEEAREAGLAPDTVLRGVFGVDSALELSAEDCERYAAMLDRALPAEYVEGEVIQGSDAEPDGPGSVDDGDERSPAPESASDTVSEQTYPDGLRKILNRIGDVQTLDPEQCILWEGTFDQDGYGLMYLAGGTRRVSRVVYEVFVGVIPDKLQIDHLCRNRACVSPFHLEAVTQKENILRGEGLTAQNARKTHCLNGHEFTPENTYYAPGRPNERGCRTCKKEQADAWYARRTSKGEPALNESDSLRAGMPLPSGGASQVAESAESAEAETDSELIAGERIVVGEPLSLSAEEPEPGPYDEVDADAENLALVGATLIPDGQYKGQRLDEVATNWLRWALKRDAAKWPAGFLTALETYVVGAQPEIWREVRG